MNQDPVSANESDDLPQEAVSAAKRRSRINALILAAVFLLIAVAPRPWSNYAPLLLIIPAVYAIVSRMRSAQAARGLPSSETPPQVEFASPSSEEPYSYSPKDPKDPRRYKPIG